MVTEEQEKDRARLKRYIELEQLVSVLNDTKWNRLYEALLPIQGPLCFLRKDIRDPENLDPVWCTEIGYIFAGWESIEWLSVRAIIKEPQGELLPRKTYDFSDELIRAVREAGIPYSQTEDGIKIWGYLRPGVSPEWAR